LTGDFPTAASAVLELDHLAAGDTSLDVHRQLTSALMSFLEEQGDGAKAMSVAESFEQRAPGWTADTPDWVRLRLVYEQHHAARLGDAEFRRAREAFDSETAKRWGETNPMLLYGRVGRGKGAWEARIRGERARAGTRPEACKNFS
jgi:hypothetical protein